MSQKVILVQTKVDMTSSRPASLLHGIWGHQHRRICQGQRREGVYLMDPTTSLVLLLGDIFSNVLYAKLPQHPACHPMHCYVVCGHLISLSYTILSCKMKGRLEMSSRR